MYTLCWFERAGGRVDRRAVNRWTLALDLQHLAAYDEGSELPRKIESSHSLLVHSITVGPPVLLDYSTEILPVPYSPVSAQL